MSSDEALVVTTAQEDEEFLFAFNQTMISTIPMVLKAIIELGILKLLSESSAQLSPTQITSRLSIKNPDAAVTIDRILRLLDSFSFLSCTLMQDKAGRLERMYALGPSSKYFVREQGGSFTPWLLFLFDKVCLSTWFRLKDVVIEGKRDPFELANGAIIFDYTRTDPKLNDYFNNAMTCLSTIYMGKVMDYYCGFKGAKTIVDIGSGVGECLKLILLSRRAPRGGCTPMEVLSFTTNEETVPEWATRSEPDISPKRLTDIPSLGLEHVGGSFVTDPIPKGDILMLKRQFHCLGDDFALQLLKNCWNALLDSGMVVIIDPISPEYLGTDLLTRTTFTSDMIMLGLTPGGKDRTMREVEATARAAGFSSVKVGCRFLNMWVLELYKTA